MEEKKQEIINFCINFETEELFKLAYECFGFACLQMDSGEAEFIQDGIEKIIEFFMNSGKTYEEVSGMISNSENYKEFIIMAHDKVKETGEAL